MSILKILGSVVKGAVTQVKNDAITQIIPPVTSNSKLESKVHELTTILSQLIVSVLSLIKLIRAIVPDSLWKSPKS